MVAGKQIDGVSAGLIVGKPTPTGFCGLPQYRCSTRSLWELACQR